MKEFGLKPLHYISLPGYSFDCWLMSSGVSLDTLQDKQMLDGFVEAKRGGICGIMGDRIVKKSNGSKMAKHRRSRFKDDQNQGTCFADLVHRCEYPIRLCNDAKTTL